MKLRELLSELEGIDPDIDVVIQTRIDSDIDVWDDTFAPAELDGLVWEITDDRSFEITYGKLHILADYQED